MRIRVCERKFPDSGHKPEGKEVFIRRIQKRGTGNSLTLERILEKLKTWRQALNLQQETERNANFLL